MFYVLSVIDSTPCVKRFKTLAAAKRYKTKVEKMGTPDNGYWVDYIFEGKLLYKDPTVN